MVRIIDLSVPFQNGATEPSPPTIEYWDHANGAERMAKLAGVQASDFPDSLALASEKILGFGHSGTHVDAPYHYGPTHEGKPARTIDEVPLEWCYGNGVVLDMRHKNPGDEITVEDLHNALEKINYTLQPLDIVILQTGCDKYWGTDLETYLSMQSGLGYKGTKWILDQGIRCIGIDAWTLDRPAKAMGQAFKETGDRSELWASHMYGRKHEYLQIEKLAHLDQLPGPTGFKIAAFPCKFEKCSAGWTRAVAIIEE